MMHRKQFVLNIITRIVHRRSEVLIPFAWCAARDSNLKRPLTSFVEGQKVSSLSSGAPQGIRTPDLWFRRPTLYPAELAAHKLLKRINLKLSFYCSKKGESANAH